MLNMLSNPFGGCLRRRPENERVLVGDKRGSRVRHRAASSLKMAFVSLKILKLP